MFEEALRLDLEHRYFADTRCRGLRIAPDSETSRLFKRPDLALRIDEHGLTVVMDRQSAALQTLLEDGVIDLRFFARIGDPDWAYMTEFSLIETDTPPVLTASAVVTEDARQRLHSGEVLTRDDLAGSQAETDEPLRWSPALFGIVLPLDSSVTGLTRYVVRFGARLTYWRYNIVGEFDGDSLRIIDTLEGQTFDPPAPATLANDRPAIRLRSSRRLPLEERPKRHFQLLASNGSEERVIMRKLPVASIGKLADEGTISEIYVHSGT